MKTVCLYCERNLNSRLAAWCLTKSQSHDDIRTSCVKSAFIDVSSGDIPNVAGMNVIMTGVDASIGYFKEIIKTAKHVLILESEYYHHKELAKEVEVVSTYESILEGTYNWDYRFAQQVELYKHPLKRGKSQLIHSNKVTVPMLTWLTINYALLVPDFIDLFDLALSADKRDHKTRAEKRKEALNMMQGLRAFPHSTSRELKALMDKGLYEYNRHSPDWRNAVDVRRLVSIGEMITELKTKANLTDADALAAVKILLKNNRLDLD